MTRITVTLTPEVRGKLHAWQRSTTITAGQARRGRVVLLRAQGHSITEIAARVEVTRRFVYIWLARFLVHGIDGLADRPRPGRPHKRVKVRVR